MPKRKSEPEPTLPNVSKELQLFRDDCERLVMHLYRAKADEKLSPWAAKRLQVLITRMQEQSGVLDELFSRTTGL